MAFHRSKNADNCSSTVCNHSMSHRQIDAKGFGPQVCMFGGRSRGRCVRSTQLWDLVMNRELPRQSFGFRLTVDRFSLFSLSAVSWIVGEKHDVFLVPCRNHEFSLKFNSSIPQFFESHDCRARGEGATRQSLSPEWTGSFACWALLEEKAGHKVTWVSQLPLVSGNPWQSKILYVWFNLVQWFARKDLGFWVFSCWNWLAELWSRC